MAASIRWRPKGCQKERALNKKTTILYPPSPALEEHNPLLHELLKSFHTSGKLPTKRVMRHINDHWKVNVTLNDADWEKERVREDGELDSTFDPSDAESHI